MVSKVAKDDIYIELPEGYKAPVGYVARLRNMLYGCCDASQVFHTTFTKWLMAYGFEPLDTDRTLFKLKCEDDTVMLLALYVDDGLVSHNSDEAYAAFIKALSTRFELSAESTEVSWYLGVSIHRDWEKGTIKLSQEQYVKDLLERFEMTDCNPVLTPMEVGQRLTIPDRARRRSSFFVLGISTSV